MCVAVGVCVCVCVYHGRLSLYAMLIYIYPFFSFFLSLTELFNPFFYLQARSSLLPISSIYLFSRADETKAKNFYFSFFSFALLAFSFTSFLFFFSFLYHCYTWLNKEKTKHYLHLNNETFFFVLFLFLFSFWIVEWKKKAFGLKSCTAVSG